MVSKLRIQSSSRKPAIHSMTNSNWKCKVLNKPNLFLGQVSQRTLKKNSMVPKTCHVWFTESGGPLFNFIWSTTEGNKWRENFYGLPTGASGGLIFYPQKHGFQGLRWALRGVLRLQKMTQKWSEKFPKNPILKTKKQEILAILMSASPRKSENHVQESRKVFGNPKSPDLGKTGTSKS